MSCLERWMVMRNRPLDLMDEVPSALSHLKVPLDLFADVAFSEVRCWHRSSPTMHESIPEELCHADLFPFSAFPLFLPTCRAHACAFLLRSLTPWLLQGLFPSLCVSSPSSPPQPRKIVRAMWAFHGTYIRWGIPRAGVTYTEYSLFHVASVAEVDRAHSMSSLWSSRLARAHSQKDARQTSADVRVRAIEYVSDCLVELMNCGAGSEDFHRISARDVGVVVLGGVATMCCPFLLIMM